MILAVRYKSEVGRSNLLQRAAQARPGFYDLEPAKEDTDTAATQQRRQGAPPGHQHAMRYHEKLNTVERCARATRNIAVRWALSPVCVTPALATNQAYKTCWARLLGSVHRLKEA